MNNKLSTFRKLLVSDANKKNNQSIIIDSPLHLTIELIPKPCWNINLRKTVSQTIWKNIRTKVFEKYQNRCTICNADGLLHCHECWRYDDVNHCQTLTDLIALCKWCHYVKHIGYAEILAATGKLNYQTVIEHFRTINNCSYKQFQYHRDQAFIQWKERNQYHWQINFEDYISILANKKQQIPFE